MNSLVIANEAKQSTTPDCMDCRAALAVTTFLFKAHAASGGHGRLAMTIIFHASGVLPSRIMKVRKKQVFPSVRLAQSAIN